MNLYEEIEEPYQDCIKSYEEKYGLDYEQLQYTFQMEDKEFQANMFLSSQTIERVVEEALEACPPTLQVEILGLSSVTELEKRYPSRRNAILEVQRKLEGAICPLPFAHPAPPHKS